MMWEEVDIEIVRKAIREEKLDAQKKFWAYFLLWVIICMIWIMGVVPYADTMAMNPRMIQISYLILTGLLLVIVLVVYNGYTRQVRVLKEAKYMIRAPFKARERMSVKGSGNLFQDFFVSFTKPGNRDSGWVITDAEFYNKCSIGTEMLIIAADQSDSEKMRAFDPAFFNL